MKLTSTFLALGLALAASAQTNLNHANWTIDLSADNVLTIQQNGSDLFNNAFGEVTYRIAGNAQTATINTLGKAPESTSATDFSDELGSGKRLELVYTDGTARFIQSFNIYSDQPYMVAQGTVSAIDGSRIESNHFIALATRDNVKPMSSSDVRMVSVPFDNDGHGRYCVFNLVCPITSYEVGYALNLSTGRGLIAGSIDHDKWKSGIEMDGTKSSTMTRLEMISGYTSAATRDYDNKQNIVYPHGYVKGTEVSSARFLVGLFDDWREGMNTFAESCATVCPPAPWDKGNPMGWSSWGVMMNHVKPKAVLETVKWMGDNLRPLGFHDNDNQCVVSLDSFCEGWGFSQAELISLHNCLGTEPWRNGRDWADGLDMRLGMYGGMVIWDWTLDSTVEGCGQDGIPDYKWGDCALLVNGKTHSVAGGSYLAIDPTHPAFKANVECYMKRWSEKYDIKYIKMDFINAGICEGDSWYDPEITTGVMAYSYGMKIIYDLAKKYDMYIVESMSPLFPYQYAHGRRTCCDRFSELDESEYVMNAMTWGWWTDRLYAVNDPDQLVLCKDGHNMQETLGVNRVRATTGVCTGAFIIGDSFSERCVYTDGNGHKQGDVVAFPEESKKRALQIFGNADINEYVRENIGSFEPVDPERMTSGQQTCKIFRKENDQYVYVAIFNWDRNAAVRNATLRFDRLGIDPTNAGEIKELWLNEPVTRRPNYFSYEVPAGDCRVYRIAKKDFSGIEDVTADKAESSLSAVITRTDCTVASPETISAVRVFDLSGKLMASADEINHMQASIPMTAAPGVYIVNATLASGVNVSTKVISK